MAELPPLSSYDLVGEKLTIEQQKIIDEWKKQLNGEISPCFEDGEFLRLFLENVPSEKQFSYVKNTTEYLTKANECDKTFVLVFRRSTPTEKPKPEIFWSTEFAIPLFGLKKEQPMHSERRIKSYIWVSTIESILENGDGEDNEFTTNKYGTAASDGEIRINPIPYDKSKCLFIYKPKSEKQELEDFIKRQDDELTL